MKTTLDFDPTHKDRETHCYPLVNMEHYNIVREYENINLLK